MKKLIQFPLESGGTITVEVDETDEAGGTVRVSRPGEIADKATQSFEDALQNVIPATEAVIKKLSGMIQQPDEIGIEFGLKLTAQAGAIIAAAGVEANFKITLNWKHSK